MRAHAKGGIMNKKTLLALCLVITVLALANIACDDVGSDVPRIGDGMRIGEALEKTTCEATGGRWDNARNVCK
jgi:hypothetical protein